MNYLAIVQRIMREAGRTDGEPDSIANAVGDARLAADWAADAARNLDLEAHNWRWLIKRVAAGIIAPGSATVTAASMGLTDFARWREAGRDWSPVVTDGTTRWALRWMPYDAWLMRFAAPHDAAPPAFWSVTNDGALALGPTPNVALTIDIQYRRSATQLAADADVPLIPDESLHSIIVWRALAETGGYESAPEMFSRAAANYDKMPILRLLGAAFCNCSSCLAASSKRP